MSINGNYSSSYVKKAATNTKKSTTAAAAAEGGFINEVLSGSLPMVALNYSGTVFRTIRHPKNFITAIKQTNNIITKLQKSGKLASLSQAQAANVYGETFRTIHKNLNAGKKVKGAKVAKNIIKSAKANTVTIKQATTAGSKVLNWTKNALKTGGFKGMAIFSSLFELPELYSAFSKGGFGEGVKQTGKSAVKVAADSAGWAIGSVGGGAIGAKIGFAIGTAIPGVGNLLGVGLGAAVGTIIGGLSGSWIGRKTSKAIVGKSFSEKNTEINNYNNEINFDYSTAYRNDPLRGYQPQLNPYLSKGYNGIY